MLVLAVDTSGRHGGITLARGDAEQFEIIESAAIEGGTFSAELIPQISALLEKHNFKAEDLQGLIAVTGPGSFTGLRVGLTAAKGLAEVLKIPIATATSLELLIAASNVGDNVLALLDAGRGEVYAAQQLGVGRKETLLSVSEAVDRAKKERAQVIVREHDLAGKFENSRLVSYQSSEVAARIGIEKLFRGDTVDVLALDANYIRKSEAEYKKIS